MAADDEFGDVNRQRLIERLNDLLRNPGEDFMLPPSQWAALWLSDLGILSELVTAAESMPFIRALLSHDTLSDTVLKPWNQRSRDSSARSGMSTPRTDSLPALSIRSPLTPQHQRVVSLQEHNDDHPDRAIEQLLPVDTTGSGKSASSRASSKRSESAKKSCRLRDSERCILTQAGRPVEVAHIYPFSMNAVSQNSSFWSDLRTFWPQEKIDEWKSVVFTEQKTEILENLVTLSPNAHAYWTKALFALKPLNVADDGKSMDVQFFWLRPYIRLRSIRLTTRPEQPSDLKESINNIKLFNHITDKKLCSGDIITLRTEDAQEKPLPSKELLEMQWLLHRLTALSGGAEAIPTYYDSDNDDSLDYIHLADEMDELDDADSSTEVEMNWPKQQFGSSQKGLQTAY